MRKRELDDRIETYKETFTGMCSCGTIVLKTIGSDATNWKDKIRFHYPTDTSASNIFRCGLCLKPIRETWFCDEEHQSEK